MPSLMALLRAAWVLLPLTLAVRMLAEIWRDPDISATFWRRSVWALVGFFAYMSVMVLILVGMMKANAAWLPSVPPLLGFILGWSAFGALWLIRLAPQRRRPAEWLLRRWGALDWVLLAIIAVSIAML